MDSKEKAKRYSLMIKYGLTLEERREMENKQSNKCWICKNPPKLNSLAVDHAHIKGYKKLKPEEKKKHVRGLLCMYCNKYVVGGIERRIDCRNILENLYKYFKHFTMKGDK